MRPFRVCILPLLALSLPFVGCSSARPRVASPPAAALARPGDDVSHPGSHTEWWYVHAVEPGSGRTVIAVFFSAPLAAVGGFLYTATRMTNWTALSSRRVQVGPGVLLAAGGIRYEKRRRAWLVDERARGYRLHLVLSQTRPGITAGPLRFGSEEGSWTIPVATGRADGAISTPGGGRVVIRNWRAYHDHNWGTFSLESRAYRGWEWAAVHEAPGSAWVLGGVNLLDGRFAGVLIRVTPTRTTACQPAIRRRHWATSGGFRIPLIVTASCNGRSVSFRVVRPYVVPLTTYALSESVGRTDTPGSIGLIEHLARR